MRVHRGNIVRTLVKLVEAIRGYGKSHDSTHIEKVVKSLLNFENTVL